MPFNPSPHYVSASNLIPEHEEELIASRLKTRTKWISILLQNRLQSFLEPFRLPASYAGWEFRLADSN